MSRTKSAIKSLEDKYPLPLEVHGVRLIGRNGRVVREKRFNEPFAVGACDTLKIMYSIHTEKTHEVSASVFRRDLSHVQRAIKKHIDECIAGLLSDVRDLGVRK